MDIFKGEGRLTWDRVEILFLYGLGLSPFSALPSLDRLSMSSVDEPETAVMFWTLNLTLELFILEELQEETVIDTFHVPETVS